VEESTRKRDQATARIASAKEATADEAVIAMSTHRPIVRREDVMDLLKSVTWLGRTIALQGLLELVSKMSLLMQTVNVIPWELMAEQ
jgi:hypothetical protein